MNQKKKYVISLLYQVQKDVEVEANSLEEAKNLALRTGIPAEDRANGETKALCKTLFARDNATGKVWYPKKDVA